MSKCMKYIISRRPLLSAVIIIKKKIKKAVLVIRKKDVRSSHRPACSHGISQFRGLENGEDLSGVKDHGSIGTGVMGHFDIWTQQDRHRRIDRGLDALPSWRHTSSWPFVPWQPVAQTRDSPGRPRVGHGVAQLPRPPDTNRWKRGVSLEKFLHAFIYHRFIGQFVHAFTREQIHHYSGLGGSQGKSLSRISFRGGRGPNVITPYRIGQLAAPLRHQVRGDCHEAVRLEPITIGWHHMPPTHGAP